MFSLVSTAALFSSVTIAFSISASKEKECLPLQSLLNLGCSLFWILVSYSVVDAHEVLSILFPRRGVLLSVLWLISSAVPWWQASPSSICWSAICTSLLMKSRLIFYFIYLFFLFPRSAEIGSHSAGQAILEPTMQPRLTTIHGNPIADVLPCLGFFCLSLMQGVHFLMVEFEEFFVSCGC